MGFSSDPRIAVWEKEKARIDADEPPPNYKDPPRRHHYVPQFYLERFSKRSSSKATPRIKRIEAKGGLDSAVVLGVPDAAVEVDFYRVEADDPRRAQEAEHIIGIFETTAGYAFANLDRGGANHLPDDIDRQNLACFMALQFARGPDTVDFQERAATLTSRMVMRQASTMPDYIRRRLLAQGDDASDEAVAQMASDLDEAARTAVVTPHRNNVVASIFRGVSTYFPYFYERRWGIARTPIPLLTSDRPIVLLQQPGRRKPWEGVGLGTADMIVFVLDRNRALVMQQPEPEHKEGIATVSAAFARQLNAQVANHARRWVFYHPDDNPLDGVPFNPNPR